MKLKIYDWRCDWKKVFLWYPRIIAVGSALYFVWFRFVELRRNSARTEFRFPDGSSSI